jgi:hypothetical protein
MFINASQDGGMGAKMMVFVKEVEQEQRNPFQGIP